MKEFNIKRHYCTKHAARYDDIEGQLRFDEIEQFKKSLSMQEVFHAYEKDAELVTKLSFEIIQKKKKLTVMVNSLRIIWRCSLAVRFQKRNV